MRSGVLLPFGVCLVGCLFAGSRTAVAQDCAGEPVDTSAVSSRETFVDTSAVAPAVALQVMPFGDEPYVVGVRTDTMRPADGYYLDLTRSMSLGPGAFSYDLGNVGWPHQLSTDGMSPTAIELSVDGAPVRDPSTNRPLFDVLPIDLLLAPRTALFAHGGPLMVETHIRPIDERRPYTELRYMTGGGSLQSISGLHVQQRQWRIFGATTVTQFATRLAFHEWSGRYPNGASDLDQVFGRIGFTSRRWRVRVSNAYSLRARGAHSGVIQSGPNFDSVYDELGALVADPSAQQRHQRNQFDLSVEHAWESGLRPLVIRSSFTKSLYRYTNVDTAETRSSEFRLRFEQSAPEFVTGHVFTGRMSFESVDLSSDGLLAGGGGATKSRFLFTVDDRFSAVGFDVLAAVGIRTVRDWTYPSASIDLTHRFSSGYFAAVVALNEQTPSELEIVGGLGVEAAEMPVSSGATRNFRLSGGLTGGANRLELTFFTSERVDPVEIVRIDDNNHSVIQMSGTHRVVGLSAMAGWRTGRDRGFYGSIAPTIQNLASLDQLSDELPEVHGNARFGYRSLLFKGDLDLDVHLLGRFWSSFVGRTYDPVHALMVLPEVDSRPVDGSATLDVRLQAGIRTATIWLSLDNALAGWANPGSMTVPVYPLPARAFRFGVSWPIWG